MKNPLSKTQIDQLGDRLRAGSHTEEDLRLLDDYRLSFGEAYETVVQKIREHGESPTGRQPKSKLSIIEKLKRQKTRLSRMQDIAGCRIVVADVVQQDAFVAVLRTLFPGSSEIDRRDKPSHGYRAVHVIAQVSEKPIEIQVRSLLQHLWAELSERASDVIDPTIKYGGGPDEWRSFLTKDSKAVAGEEELEKSDVKVAKALVELEEAIEEEEKTAAEQSDLHEPNHDVQEARKGLGEIQAGMEEMRPGKVQRRNELAELLNRKISLLDERRLKGQKQ